MTKDDKQDDKLEAGEKMIQRDEIIQEWEEDQTKDQTEDVSYQVPLDGKPIPDVGKCRVVMEFPSLSEAEAMVAEYIEYVNIGQEIPYCMFWMDSLNKNKVPDNRTFIVRKADQLPTMFRLEKKTVRVTPAGG